MRVGGLSGDCEKEKRFNMATVRDILKKYGKRPIILFLRDGDSTSMHMIESINDFKMNVLEREIMQSHISVFKNIYHIELTV